MQQKGSIIGGGGGHHGTPESPPILSIILFVLIFLPISMEKCSVYKWLAKYDADFSRVSKNNLRYRDAIETYANVKYWPMT